VALVAILDADKEGFLRSTTSLIQTAGRAARHLRGRVILYADTMTRSINQFMAATEYRRKRQLEHNAAHGITPRSVSRSIEESLHSPQEDAGMAASIINDKGGDFDVVETIRELEGEMLEAAEKLEFEKAALLRDQIRDLKIASGEKPKAGASPAKAPMRYAKSARKSRRP
jgi:excinuclease ABC subunit B